MTERASQSICACGITFPIQPIGRPRKFCSDRCRSRQSNARSRHGFCRSCQRQFDYSRSSKNVRFCPECRYAARILPDRGRELYVIDGAEQLRCTRCSEVRPLADFPRGESYKYGRATWCRPCYHEYNQSRRDRAIHQERFYKYGIAAEDQDQLWDRQGGRCASCSYLFERLGEAHLDHDHASGRVRAFLCAACNHILGLCGEDVDHLVAVAEYLLAQRALEGTACALR